MNTKFLIGGLLAGVAVGLLLSPATNAETKEKLINGARRLVDFLGGINTLKENVNQGVNEVASKAKAAIDSTSERIKV